MWLVEILIGALVALGIVAVIVMADAYDNSWNEHDYKQQIKFIDEERKREIRDRMAGGPV